MNVSNILSAIGNNNSVYPLIVRDCGIEVPVKIAMTYEQNKKESKKVAYLAARERFLDEYATSAVWLGGIPLIGKLCNFFIKKKGLNPDVNLKLFQNDKYQGIDINIQKFKNIAPEAVKDLQKVKTNKKLFEKLLAGKFLLSTSIPILFMGFILPKLVFKSSAKKIAELKENKTQNPSFTGNWISKAANFSAQDKMAVTDGGYAVGRVTTARNKNESLDLAFKMTGMMFLNFVMPKQIEKFLNKMTGVTLDPVMLADKEFLKEVKNNTLKLPKTSAPEDLFKFIDNPANKDTFFIKYANKFGKIKTLQNGIRDPREFVDVQALGNFRNNIDNFIKNSKNSADFEKFVKKSKISKTANILTNVVLSSFLLAYALPKAQFAFRKVVTGSDIEPGLVQAKM